MLLLGHLLLHTHVGIVTEALLLLGHLLLHAHVGIVAEALLLLGHLLLHAHVGVVAEALLLLGHLLLGRVGEVSGSKTAIGYGRVPKNGLDGLVPAEGVFALFWLPASHCGQEANNGDYALYFHGFPFFANIEKNTFHSHS